jgi:hypothetical protein
LTIRATHHGFPPLMVVTSLVEEILHTIGMAPAACGPPGDPSSCVV